MNPAMDRRIWLALFPQLKVTLAALAILLVGRDILGAADQPIVYSTFLGAGTGRCLAIDSAGNAYIAGNTHSRDFPVLNAWQPELAGDGDCYLVKLDPAGRPIFSTYFGGSGQDSPLAMAVDGDGNVYLAGFTTSVDLPTTPGAFQEDYAGGTAFGFGDAFVAKFSKDGSQLLFCSYLGGSGDDICGSIAIDSEGNVLLAGSTDSADFPHTRALGPRRRQDAFIAKLDSRGERLLWSTLVAGENGEAEVQVKAGADGATYFTGATVSPDLPVTPDALHARHQLCTSELGVEFDRFCEDLLPQHEFYFWDSFLGILEPDGSLRYLSYLGRDLLNPADLGVVLIKDFVLSPGGALFMTGEFRSTAQAAPAWNVFQPSSGGGGIKAFIARLDPPDWQLAWFSYLGGVELDGGSALAIDANEQLYIAGNTNSRDFPLRDPLPKRGDGSWDGFLAKVSPDGGTLLYSTLIGGTERDSVFRVAMGPDGLPVLAGVTASSDFPIHNAFHASRTAGEGQLEAFAMKLGILPVRPALEIRRSGNSVIVSWPGDAEGFVLESSAKLEAGAWTVVPDTPLVLGSQRAVVVRASAQTQFFRLRRP
jgi:hypothetical protein